MNLDEYEFIYVEVYVAALDAGNSPANAKIKAEEAWVDFENQMSMGDASFYAWVQAYSRGIRNNQGRAAAVSAGNTAVINMASSFSDVFDRRT